jgi:leucyl-tRNA synthetase
LLKKDTPIVSSRWPTFEKPADASLIAAANYVRGLTASIRSAEDVLARKKAKKGGAADEPMGTGRTLKLFVASTYPEWQDAALVVLKETWDETTKTFVRDRELLGKRGLLKDKKVMPFVADVKKKAETMGAKALDRTLLFNESETLELNLDFIRREMANLKIAKVEVALKEKLEEDDSEDISKAQAAAPGAPSYRIV